jgi:hypothetical protein
MDTMTTKTTRCALYEHKTFGYETVWSFRPDGSERDIPDYIRISEYVDIEFTLLPGDVVAEHKRRELESERTRLQERLAALDGAK